MSPQWISQQADLDAFVDHLKRLEWVVIDTEADSFHHFQEKLCLVQLLTPKGVTFVDPLVSLDFHSFWNALGARKWRIHASDYDLRVIRKAGGGVPPEIFDTFLAAQILGKKALSYSALVLEYTGTTLSKSNQKADWTLRPLSESMIDYAAADVLYVDTIVDALRKELEAKGRTNWFHQSCQRQLRIVQKSEDQPDPDAWQISGHHLLLPQSRTVLKHLWEWRQNEARERDLAPFRVLRNDMLHAMVVDYEKNPEAEFRIPHFIRGVSRELMEAHFEVGKGSKPIPFTPPKRPDPISQEVDKRLNQLREKRQKVSEEVQMDPGIIASKSVLLELAEKGAVGAQQLIEKDRVCPWQMELLGYSLH